MNNLQIPRDSLFGGLYDPLEKIINHYHSIKTNKYLVKHSRGIPLLATVFPWSNKTPPYHPIKNQQNFSKNEQEVTPFGMWIPLGTRKPNLHIQEKTYIF